MSQIVLFSTQSYAYLRDRMCAAGQFESGLLETKTFPDGERYLRLGQAVDGRDVAVVGGTISDSDSLELYDLAGAMVDAGARSLTLVVPYFGYSTMERATQPGEVVTAKSRARMLSSLPLARFGNRIFLVDLHTEGIPYYFEGSLRTFHVYAKPLIEQAARELGDHDFVIACTDAGRAKWVESLANDMHVMASFVFKRRLSGSETAVSAVSAQVQDKRVIIYDDMIRTGSSLMGAARAYLDAGAKSIHAIATHGLFPGNALEKLQKSGLFSAIACTDSHPRAVELEPHGLKVYSIAPLLSECLMRHSISTG